MRGGVAADNATRFMQSLLATRTNNNVSNQGLLYPQHGQLQQHPMFAAPQQQPQPPPQLQPPLPSQSTNDPSHRESPESPPFRPSSSKRCSTSSSTGEMKKSSPSKSEPAPIAAEAGVIGASATAPPSLVGSRSHHGSNRSSFHAAATGVTGVAALDLGLAAPTTTMTHTGSAASTPNNSHQQTIGVTAAISAPSLHQQQQHQLMHHQQQQQPKPNFVHMGSFPRGEML